MGFDTVDPTRRARQMEGVDFGKTAADYATYRAGFPGSFFDELEHHGVPIPGVHAVDLGTGTGTVARELAIRGASAVVGIDPAVAITQEARKLDEVVGVDVKYLNTTAEKTGLLARSVDLVIAAQCWWWFKGASAAKEARRILAPGGYFVVASLDWLPLPDSVPAASEELIRKANPDWTLYGGMGRHPRWRDEVREAGFVGTKTLEYEVSLTYTAEAWRGRVRASAGIGATLTPSAVKEFDDAHALLLAERFPDQPLQVPHRIYAVITQAPMDQAP